MRQYSWVRFLFFIVIFIQLSDCQSQTIKKKYTFTWREPQSYTFENGVSEKFLYFENAVFGRDYPELPSIYEAIPVDNFFSEYEVRVIDREFADMSAEECRLVPSGFRQSNVDYQVVSAYDRKEIFALLTFRTAPSSSVTCPPEICSRRSSRVSTFGALISPSRSSA